MYNYLITSKGKIIIGNGWKQAGIAAAHENGSSKLTSLDPFQSIDPLLNEESATTLSTEDAATVCNIDIDILQGYKHMEESDDESDWEDPDYDKNIFEILDDEEA